jgi:PAS domain S-box-containing protein
MNRSTRASFALCWTLLLLAVPSASAPYPRARQVLLLYSYDRDFAPHLAFVRLFRPEVSRRSPEPLEFIEVSLQAVRASRDAPDDTMVQQIQAMLAGRQPDLVVPVGGPAALFAQQNRHELFPSAAMLLAGVDRRFVRDGIGDNETAVAVDHEPGRLVENILNVLPDTKSLFVVVGTSRLEQLWLEEMKRAFRPFEGRLTFSFANELSFSEMVKTCAKLPSHSAILFAILSLDAKGEPQVEERALTQLHAVANAPIFGLRSTQLGRGIVGGPLLSVEELSNNTAKVALELLEGKPAPTLRTPTQTLGAATFDARELRRWNIDEHRLPSGSVVQFRELTLWQRYKVPLVVIAALAGVQVALVIGLVANHTRRRRTRQAFRDAEPQSLMLSNVAPVMLWSAGPDGMRTEVNRAWLDFTGRPVDAELGNGWTEGVHPDDLARRRDVFDQAFDRREPFRTEWRLRRHGGDYRWILEMGVPRVLSDGSFAGYVGSALDITDLKLASISLSNLSRRLMETHERERASVARELQDDLCQRLMGLAMQLHGVTQPQANHEDEQVRRSIETLSRQFSDLATEIFAKSEQLYTSKLELFGLPVASRVLCWELSRQHGVNIEFRDQGVPADLSSEIAVGLFGVLQEALRNAVNHSNARRLLVLLRVHGGEIHLDVADEGIGFDTDAVMRGQGLGLLAMRERISAIGGEFAIDSRAGAGTRVRARVPVPRDVLRNGSMSTGRLETTHSEP